MARGRRTTWGLADHLRLSRPLEGQWTWSKVIARGCIEGQGRKVRGKTFFPPAPENSKKLGVSKEVLEVVEPEVSVLDKELMHFGFGLQQQNFSTGLP